jgi:hypothetical protein
MNSDDDAADREMLLAEFSALRAEILQWTSMQWNIFALQLTASGVVFSFALQSFSRDYLANLAVITYALTGRYVSQYFGVQNVNIQALQPGVAVGDRWLRFSGGCGVAVVAVRDFRDDCGL